MTWATWALILFFMNVQKGGATTVYFDTQESCLAAKAKIEAQYEESWAGVIATCVQTKEWK